MILKYIKKEKTFILETKENYNGWLEKLKTNCGKKLVKTENPGKYMVHANKVWNVPKGMQM